MKPANWDAMNDEEQATIAQREWENGRGQHIVGKALWIAAKVLRAQAQPELSDADDMEMLGETLFRNGYALARYHEETLEVILSDNTPRD